MSRNSEDKQRKRKRLSIDDKCQILQRLETGEPAIQLAAEFGIAKSTVSAIKKCGENIINTRYPLESCQDKIDEKFKMSGNSEDKQRKRKTLSVNDKCQILERLKTREPAIQLTAKFRVAKSTVSAIKNCEKNIINTRYPLESCQDKIDEKFKMSGNSEDKQRKRKSLSVDDKCQILQRLETGKPAIQLTAKFEVAKSTVSAIKNCEENIINTRNTLESCQDKIDKKSEMSGNLEGKQRKRKSLSIGDKCQILQRLESGESAVQLAAEFGVARSTVSAIKKCGENIINIRNTLESCQGNLNKKKHRGTENTVLEQKLYAWFVQMRSMGWLITGPILRKQALKFHHELGISSDFNASNGWLTLFKKRHGIKHLSMQGEKLSADPIASEAFKETLNTIMNVTGLNPDYIYNCDETGLFWKLLPNKTFITKHKKMATGRKKPKNRVTLMACTNASGTHKIKLFVIGKPKQPRCLTNIGNLPVIYDNQENACMTTDLMLNWYTTVFIPEIIEKHDLENNSNIKLVLIMDNAPCHPSEETFNSVCDFCTVIFLPPTVTSLIQPLNQGIIEKFKRCYRNSLLETILARDTFEESDNVSSSMTLLDCCNLCAFAWTKITSDDIRTCWKQLIPLESNTQIDSIDVRTFHSLVQQIPSMESLVLQDIKNWLYIDSLEVGWEPRSDENILFEGSNENIEELSDEVAYEDEEFNEEVDSQDNTVCATEAVNAIQRYMKWYQQSNKFFDSQFTVLQECKQIAIKEIISRKMRDK